MVERELFEILGAGFFSRREQALMASLPHTVLRLLDRSSLVLVRKSTLRWTRLVHESALFDDAFYLAENPSLLASGEDPLAHFLAVGGSTGRMPCALFDSAWYLEKNPDVHRVGMNPLVHYLLHGASEGRDPHWLFDTSFYLEQNPDVALSGINPLTHYILHGSEEGRDPHPLFSHSYYERACAEGNEMSGAR